jgi:hypothetical protein
MIHLVKEIGLVQKKLEWVGEIYWGVSYRNNVIFCQEALCPTHRVGSLGFGADI